MRCCRWPVHASSAPVTLRSRIARSAFAICAAMATGSAATGGGSTRGVGWALGVAVGEATVADNSGVAVARTLGDADGALLETAHAPSSTTPVAIARVRLT